MVWLCKTRTESGLELLRSFGDADCLIMLVQTSYRVVDVSYHTAIFPTNIHAIHMHIRTCIGYPCTYRAAIRVQAGLTNFQA